jgi:hypothetical protein
MRTVVGAVAAAAVTFCVVAASAAPPSLSVSPTSVRRGHLVRINGSADGCNVGNTVFILSRAFPHAHEFAGVPAVLAKVRSGGAFHATTRIPRTRRPARYGVTARCGGGNLGVSAHLRVRR